MPSDTINAEAVWSASFRLANRLHGGLVWSGPEVEVHREEYTICCRITTDRRIYRA
jgi:hypothetical protein